MIPAAARAAERLFGGALQPAAGAFRAVALVALLVCLVWPAIRAGRAIARRRRPPVPSLERRRRLDSLAIVHGFLAVAAVLAAGAFRIADPRASPIAAMSGCAGFLLFAAALLLAGAAASSGEQGPAPRILAVSLGALVLAPAAVLLFFSRAADPPKPVAIGSLWRTPTALYVSAGRRCSREGDATGVVEADLVEARSALFGLSRQDLAGFHAGGRVIPWRGAGGFGARLAARWPEALSGPLFSVRHARRDIPLPTNDRFWILSGPDGIAFVDASTAESPPDAATEPQR